MIDFLLLLFLVVCAVAVVKMRDLLAGTVVMAAYSLVIALVWTRLNAVDVALTEAAVGAGVTTVLALAAISRSKRYEADFDPGKFKMKLLARFAVTMTALALVYGAIDMPEYASSDSPANRSEVTRYYIERSKPETGSYNIVTAVLASYRGFDTFGEVAVIFTAATCVIMILRPSREKED